MIDILLATCNGEDYLEEQLDSLLRQSFTDFTVLARDDGSADKTPGILRRYADENPLLIRCLPPGEPTGSAMGNFFELLKLSTGDYTMFCDQDDVWLFDKVERTLRKMREAEEKFGDVPILAHTDLVVADENLHEIAQSFVGLQKLNTQYTSLNRLVAQNNITGCTMMINRPLRELVRQNPGALMHDWWIGLAAAAFGYIVYDVQPSMLYRQHGHNEVGAQDVGSADYFKNKTADKDGIHRAIHDTYMQASAFLETYRDVLSSAQKEMLAAYAGLGGKNAWKRFLTLQKYHCFKNGLHRKIGQIVYG